MFITMHYNSLELQKFKIQDSVTPSSGSELKYVEVIEFFVDKVALSQLLGIDRNVSSLPLSSLDSSPEASARALQMLAGIIPPSNQLGSKRMVLYSCHCGSDYCGVISCELRFTQDQVIWGDFACENEIGKLSLQDSQTNYGIKVNPIPNLNFAKEKYLKILKSFQRL